MRKSIGLIGLLIVFKLSLFAKQVDENTAKQVGQNFLTTRTNSQAFRTLTGLNLVYTAKSKANLTGASVQEIIYLYVFNVGTSGFVIVAGDDNVTPILSYSDEGTFDPNKINNSIQKWLEGYKNEIRYTIDNNISATQEIQEEWINYLNGSKKSALRSAAGVNPLLLTKWDQAPDENGLCPFDNIYNQRTVTGCPATAMAQIMKYWNYPAVGTGFHSYNHQKYGTLSANFGGTTYQWGSMPNTLTSTNNAIATLMYHCGVAVEMNYGVSETGGSSSYVIIDYAPSAKQTCENAFKTYFGYNPSTIKGLKRSNYSDYNWISLLKNELDQKRPIQYAGFGSGGHTWVCDGYDDNNFFHMNWGWGGSQDGYFLLNALNPRGGGIGGAGYTYNNNQQAIIGIQPSSGGTRQTYDLRLYSKINLPSTQIWFTDPFSLTVDIGNFGTTNFSGQLGAAIFDKDYNFINFMAITNANITNGFYYSGTFKNSGSANFVPGTYYVALFYKTSTQDWTIVGNGSYTNFNQFQIYYSADIETNSAFKITNNGGKFIQGQTATINVDVLNTKSTFFGQFRVSLSNLDGTFAQSIQIYNENTGLPNNYHYQGGIDFKGAITVAPGTYLLEVAFKAQGSSNWYYAGSSSFSNPNYVIVEAPNISPDIYENNNVLNNAYLLPISFSGNLAIKNTVGSNFHIGTDYDFYKINLPTGYNYTISTRLHDSFNSGNGNTYSVDGLFAYSIDNGKTWSDFYDDLMTGNITVQNGGTISFHVAPYFSGTTGNYLLDMKINRTITTDIIENELANSIIVFPNPTRGETIIDLRNIEHSVNQVNVINLQGQVVLTLTGIRQKQQHVFSIDEFTEGIYFVQIQTAKGIITKKLILEK